MDNVVDDLSQSIIDHVNMALRVDPVLLCMLTKILPSLIRQGQRNKDFDDASNRESMLMIQINQLSNRLGKVGEVKEINPDKST